MIYWNDIYGLKKKSHLVVDMNEPTTLADAMKMARKVENSIRKTENKFGKELFSRNI